MAFINEYVSEEDIKKYNLMEILDSFSVPSHRGELLPGFRFTWTIDRDRNIFFMPVKIGCEEYPTRTKCVLWWDNKQIIVELDSCKESFLRFNEGIGKRVWELVRLNKPTDLYIDRIEIISVLKEALTVYKLDGIWHSISDYTVEFKF